MAENLRCLTGKFMHFLNCLFPFIGMNNKKWFLFFEHSSVITEGQNCFYLKIQKVEITFKKKVNGNSVNKINTTFNRMNG